MFGSSERDNLTRIFFFFGSIHICVLQRSDFPLFVSFDKENFKDPYWFVFSFVFLNITS